MPKNEPILHYGGSVRLFDAYSQHQSFALSYSIIRISNALRRVDFSSDFPEQGQTWNQTLHHPWNHVMITLELASLTTCPHHLLAWRRSNDALAGAHCTTLFQPRDSFSLRSDSAVLNLRSRLTAEAASVVTLLVCDIISTLPREVCLAYTPILSILNTFLLACFHLAVRSLQSIALHRGDRCVGQNGAWQKVYTSL